jgi:hypothetical protein
MQHDIDSVAISVSVQILGVNEYGQDGGNADMCRGRTLPWLQDTRAAHAWRSWRVTFRDVVILDRENKIHGIYNLTVHDLADTTNYAELERLLLEAAR